MGKIRCLPPFAFRLHAQSSRKDEKLDDIVISTVSSAQGDWKRELSPFIIGPCELYDGLTSRNMENAWQFSKVYKHHLDGDGYPSGLWHKWAKNGWQDWRAHRYPMGKGAVPEYSYWQGGKLGYIEARKQIYGPLYDEAVRKRPGWAKLKEIYETGEDIVLVDYDAYDHHDLGMTLTDVLNEPKRKMGHAFVLAMMLTKDKALRQLELRS